MFIANRALNFEFVLEVLIVHEMDGKILLMLKGNLKGQSSKFPP